MEKQSTSVLQRAFRSGERISRPILPPLLLKILTTVFLLLTLPAAQAEDSQSIVTAARQSLGKEMWKGYGLPNGKLGCSAALSNVLKQAGITTVHTALVTAARKQLLARGWSERTIRAGGNGAISDQVLLKDCRPGDVLLAFMESPARINAGTSAHCGIMGSGTNVYTNNYLNGIWSEVDIHQMFDYYPYITLLRCHSSDKPDSYSMKNKAGR